MLYNLQKKDRCKLKERSTSTERRRTSDVMQDDTLEFVDLCCGMFQTTGESGRENLCSNPDKRYMYNGQKSKKFTNTEPQFHDLGRNSGSG